MAEEAAPIAAGLECLACRHASRTWPAKSEPLKAGEDVTVADEHPQDMNDRQAADTAATGSGDTAADAGGSAGGSGSPYRVLARKYRPKRFEDLVGQEPMVRTLANAFETGRIAQGYMLTGVRGVGKTTTARLIARALNYSLSDRPTVHMPEFGEHCEAILESRHVDVMEMDAASHTSVENIREIIEQVRYRPVAARYKVYIIDEVHMLSKAAFNALLKTLEEPPPHVKFIFATTEIRKVPVTVLSRCQRFDLRRVEAGRLMRHLAWVCEQEGVPAEEEALRLIARAAEGSVRDSLSLLDQAIAYGQNAVRTEDVRTMLGLMDRARVIDLFEAVMGGRMEAALKQMAEQHALGADPAMVLKDLAAFTHLVTRMRILGEAGADESAAEEERRRGLELAQKLSMPVLTRAWQMLLKGIEEVEASSQPLAAAEMVLIRLAHAAEMPPPAEIAKRLLEGGGSSAPAGSGNGGAGAADGRTGHGGGAAMGTNGPAMALQGANGAALAALPGGQAHAGKPAPATGTTAQRAAATGPMPETLEAIAALAGERRDVKLKHLIERHVRPVQVVPGRLEIALTDDAPKELPGLLAAQLKAWTGQRWAVVVSDAPGGETLHERRRKAKDNYLDKVREDPAVQAVLEAFPEARILDVRPPAQMTGLEENGGDTMPAAEDVAAAADGNEEELEP